MKSFMVSACAALAFVSSTEAKTLPLARSLVRRTDAPPLPPCTSYTPFVYKGCYAAGSPATLQYNPQLMSGSMTIETCTATCKSNGFRYAGLEYYGECFCGTMLSTPAPESECNTACNGNPGQTCGGNQRFSVWEDTTFPPVDLSTIVSKYTSMGCYAEGTSFRAVPYRQNQLSSASLTTEQCLSACGNEYYPLAATEYGGECYCGAVLQGGSVKAAESECNMACTGNPAEICGGPNRLNLYEAKVLESNQPCGSTGSSSSSSSIAAAPTSTSTAPTSTSTSTTPSSTSTTPTSTSTTPTSTSTTPTSTSTSTTPTSTSTTPTTTSTSTTPTPTTLTTLTTSTTTTTTTPAPTSTSTPAGGCSGTAYGYIPGHSQTFISLGIGSNWGWVLTGTPPLSGTLYMGAGRNDLSKATVVGSFTIDHIGANLVVTYSLSAPYALAETHFYYGKTYPSHVAPGQFGHVHSGLPAGTRTDTYTIPYDASQSTYIVHAAVGGGSC